MSSKPETYSAESITTEVRRGQNQEAAREMNRDLHSSKDFQATFQKANEQIAKINKNSGSHLPQFELVDGAGKVVTDKTQAKGIKLGDTTYGTDTVRNNVTVDKKGNQEIKTADGDIKHQDKRGNEIMRGSTGEQKTIYTDANKPNDKDLVKVKSMTKDGDGNRVYEGENGVKKTIDKNLNVTIEYPNGDRNISRADGSGLTVHKDADGTAHIHTWHPSDRSKNYDVVVKPNGEYTKETMNWFSGSKGAKYEYQPGEK